MGDSQSDLVRVLVVDDDEALRTLLSSILLREGHQVIAVESAEAALSRLPEWSFDAAFLDQHLPGIDGLVLGQYLRRAHPDMHVALVTGDDAKKTVKQSKKLDIAFIAKPFQIGSILGVVERAKAAREERRARARASSSDEFAPPMAQYATELAEMFSLPSVSRRTEDALVESLRRMLFSLRHERELDERRRVAVFGGLVAARVLGMELPHLADGRTFFEEYDAIMMKHHRRTEFATEDAEDKNTREQ